MWEKIKDSAVIVAIVAGVSTVGNAYFIHDPSVEKCNIATQFLMDDEKDIKIISINQWSKISKLYAELAADNCKD